MAAVTRARSFLKAFLLVTVFAVIATAATNIIVDPFWRFDLVSIPGFNAQKPKFLFYGRMSKPGVVCRLRPATVILGTSRVDVGIDPKHPGFADIPGPVYNLALAGSGLHELDLTLRHAVHASPRLKRVLIGFDFLMFNAYREAVVFGTEVFDFEARRLLVSASDSCLRSFLYDIDKLLGPKALLFSMATVVMQRNEPAQAGSPNIMNWIALHDRDGFHSNFSDVDKIRIQRGGYRHLFGIGQELGYVSTIWRPAPDHRYCFVRDGQPNTFDTFGRIVKFARESGIDVHMFINPVHARLLIALHDAGLWPLYERWKRGMVEVLAADAAASGKPQLPLWDFSGFNSVTNERVPAADDATTVMRGFWEPSHYKKEAGDLVLDRVLGYRDPRRGVPDDFGKLLTPDTIDGWIEETRSGMADYVRSEPAEAALVRATVEKALADTGGARCGPDGRPLRVASTAGESRKPGGGQTALAPPDARSSVCAPC